MWLRTLRVTQITSLKCHTWCFLSLTQKGFRGFRDTLLLDVNSSSRDSFPLFA